MKWLFLIISFVTCFFYGAFIFVSINGIYYIVTNFGTGTAVIIVPSVILLIVGIFGVLHILINVKEIMNEGNPSGYRKL